MKKLFFLYLLGCILLIYSCANLPPSTNMPYQIIKTGYGPEDILIDTLSEDESLLISCSSRRRGYENYGEIERFKPGWEKSVIMPRINNPENMHFRPHGISIIKIKDKTYLYAISHNDKENKHPVVRYRIENEKLVFDTLINNDLLVSPNALHAFEDGSFLVCNDAGKRNSMLEKIFRLKKANIVYFDGYGNWEILAEKLGMIAGLYYTQGKVYASATLENKVYAFDFTEGKLSNKLVLTKIKGPDNIRLHDENLLIAAHVKPLAFIMHTRDKKNLSPSVVYSINRNTGKTEVIFTDQGDGIPAASTAVIWKNKLYISQIFEPFLMNVELERK